MAYLYPYGDTQQLNLDWLIEQWNEVKSQIDGSLQAEIDRVEAAITDLLTARDEAVAAQTAAQASAQAAAGSASTASGAASTATAQAQAAAGSAATAGAHASDAQGYAATAQQAAQAANNSAGAAAVSESNARNSETAAAGSALSASNSSSAAAGNALYAEGYAKGTQNGNPVSSGSPYYENNAKYYAEQAEIYGSQALITKTIENVSLAAFNDGANNAQVQELVIDVVPSQSGSGNPTPNNVRNFYGKTSAKLLKANANLLPTFTENDSQNGVTLTVNADGSVTLNGTATAITVFRSSVSTWKWNGIENCWLSGCPAGGNYNNSYSLRVDNSNFTGYSSPDIGQGIQLAPTSGNITDITLCFSIVIRSGTSCNNLIFKPMLNAGTQAKAFQKYNGTIYDVVFPNDAGTVYGASIDMVQKKLIVEMEKRIISSFSGAWGATTNGYAVYINATNKTSNKNRAICNQFIESNLGYSLMPLYSFLGGSGTITTWTFILPNTITSLEDANTWLNNLSDPLEITYVLDTPIEYDLDDINTITTLLGENSIWANSGKIKLLKYYAYENINLKINLVKSLIANVETTYTATQAYSVNDFLIVENTLYIVTASIANGATITPGTNATATTIGTQITSILNS